MENKIISVINQKGGVGKTTTVVNLAASLSIMGHNTLVVDLDPQGNATTGLGKSNTQEENNIYNLLIGNIKLEQAIHHTDIKNLDLISSTVNLSGLEVETANNDDRAFTLKQIFNRSKKDVLSKYDYIFIDCPPSLSLLTIMALVASNTVIIPLQTEFFALEGVSQLIKTIERVKQNLNKSLDIQGVILTMYDKRNKLCSQVESEARRYFDDKVYKSVIPRNVRISEAPSHGMPVIKYDRNCTGTLAYEELAKEVLEQYKSGVAA